MDVIVFLVPIRSLVRLARGKDTGCGVQMGPARGRDPGPRGAWGGFAREGPPLPQWPGLRLGEERSGSRNIVWSRLVAELLWASVSPSARRESEPQLLAGLRVSP